METNKLKKLVLKIVPVIISITKLNLKILILIVFYWMKIFFLMKISYENIFIYDISYETLIGAKPLRKIK